MSFFLSHTFFWGGGEPGGGDKTMGLGEYSSSRDIRQGWASTKRKV